MEGRIVRFVIVEDHTWEDTSGNIHNYSYIMEDAMYRDRKYAASIVANMSSDYAYVHISDIMERDGIDEDAAWETGEVQCEHADGYARVQFGKNIRAYRVVELHDNQYLL